MSDLPKPRDRRHKPVMPPYVAAPDDRRTVSPTPWELLTDVRLTDKDKLVAAILWGHMGPHGYASVTRQTLQRLTGYCSSAVYRALQRLKAAGWLIIRQRSTAMDRKPNLYQASHPIHGALKRPKVPEQMDLALLALVRGPAPEVMTDAAAQQRSRGNGAAFPGELRTAFPGEHQTKDTPLERKGGFQPTTNSDPLPIGASDWRTVLASGTKPRRAG